MNDLSTIQTINVDLLDVLMETLYANQDESDTRTAQCNVRLQGVDWTIPSDVNVFLKMHKPNHFNIYKQIGVDGFGSISGNIISFPITQSMTKVPGRVEFSLEFTKGSNVLYSTISYLRVLPIAFHYDVIEDQDEYLALKKFVDDAEKYKNLSQSYAIGTGNITRLDDETDNSKYYKELAEQSEINARTSETESKKSETNAQQYEINAKLSSDQAKTSENNSHLSEINAKKSEDNAKTSEIASSVSEANSSLSEQIASSSAQLANTCSQNASTSEANALQYSQNAKKSETNASDYAGQASVSAATASDKAKIASDKANSASQSEENALQYSNAAKEYKDKCIQIAQGLEGALIPMGTVSFLDIPTKDLMVGQMYNISDEFTSDDRFKDGSCKLYPAGTNIYYTKDDKWDVLVGDLGKYVFKTDFENHLNNKQNPHNVTAEQIGLGNVPNVTTNDQTVTYTDAKELTTLTSGEKISIAFGKIKKAVSDFISHIADKTIHTTSLERTLWNTVVNKVEKVDGKGLSTNDYTDIEKKKLDNIDLTQYVPNIRTINNQFLSDNIVLSATDVGAASIDTTDNLQEQIDELEKSLLKYTTVNVTCSSAVSNRSPFTYMGTSPEIKGTILSVVPKVVDGNWTIVPNIAQNGNAFYIYANGSATISCKIIYI